MRGQFHLREIASGRIVHSESVASDVQAAAWSDNDMALAFGTKAGEIHLIDLEDSQWKTRAIQAHPAEPGVMSLAFAPGEGSTELASTGGDGRVLVWDAPTGVVLVDELRFANRGCTLAFFRDGSGLFATGLNSPPGIGDMKIVGHLAVMRAR